MIDIKRTLHSRLVSTPSFLYRSPLWPIVPTNLIHIYDELARKYIYIYISICAVFEASASAISATIYFFCFIWFLNFAGTHRREDRRPDEEEIAAKVSEPQKNSHSETHTHQRMPIRQFARHRFLFNCHTASIMLFFSSFFFLTLQRPKMILNVTGCSR